MCCGYQLHPTHPTLFPSLSARADPRRRRQRRRRRRRRRIMRREGGEGGKASPKRTRARARALARPLARPFSGRPRSRRQSVHRSRRERRACSSVSGFKWPLGVVVEGGISGVLAIHTLTLQSGGAAARIIIIVVLIRYRKLLRKCARPKWVLC